MDNDVVSSYLKSISHIPLLKREEELDLANRMVSGRRQIAKTVQSKRSLNRLLALVPSIEDDERDNIEGLIKDPTKDNLKLLREYIVHLDFDILKQFSSTSKRLGAILSDISGAREKLINSNLRLVISVAKQYTNMGMPFIDLIQEGNIGLIKAVDKFDPDRGAKLSTLATWWIRQAVIRSLSNKSRTIRIPVHMIDAMNRAYRTLSARLDREPTPEEMQEELGVSSLDLAHVKEIMELMAGPVSIHTPLGTGPGGTEHDATYETFLEDDKDLIDAVLEKKSIRDRLLLLMSDSSPREEKILRLKIGL